MTLCELKIIVNNQLNKNSQPTLKDIAESAKVSEMTVSRVLRNSGSISDKTRQKVMDVVNELGFVPNKVAGSLATSKSNLIAVIIPTLENQVFSEVLAGITQRLESKELKPVIGLSEYDSEREEALIHSMLSWRPSGMIVSGMQHTSQTRKILERAGIPVVQIMSISNEPVDACVGVDHDKAGAIIARHFLEKGYRRIGYIGWNNRDLNAAVRLKGFKKELQKSDVRIEALVEYDEPINMQLGKSGLDKLLKSNPDIEAVYFPNDIGAAGGYFHCVSSHIQVPTDLAIAGFSGIDIGQLLPVPLTTVKIDRFEIGRRSAEVIINRLENKNPQKIQVSPLDFIQGGTT